MKEMPWVGVQDPEEAARLFNETIPANSRVRAVLPTHDGLGFIPKEAEVYVAGPAAVIDGVAMFLPRPSYRRGVAVANVTWLEELATGPTKEELEALRAFTDQPDELEITPNCGDYWRAEAPGFSAERRNVREDEGEVLEVKYFGEPNMAGYPDEVHLVVITYHSSDIPFLDKLAATLSAARRMHESTTKALQELDIALGSTVPVTQHPWAGDSSIVKYVAHGEMY